MGQVIKKYLLWAALAGILYFFLSHHIILTKSSIDLLKKEKLTLQYTLFSLEKKRLDAIMKVDELREAGIGDLLVEKGLMTEEQYDLYLRKYADDDD